MSVQEKPSGPTPKRKERSRGEVESFDNESEQEDCLRSVAWVRGKAEVYRVIISVSQLETSSYHSQGTLLSIPHNPLLCSRNPALLTNLKPRSEQCLHSL